MRKTYLKLPILLSILVVGLLLLSSAILTDHNRNEYKAPTTTPVILNAKRYPPLTINILASLDAFTPKIIRAHLGQEVNVRILSRGEHSFIIDAFKVNKEVPDNKTTIVTFVPDQVGSFHFYSRTGSDLARNMSGQIIVEK